tara:strand:- start:437 stop:586 length:150 start_codon:yes stop_codon:yes gene_type:complete
MPKKKPKKKITKIKPLKKDEGLNKLQFDVIKSLDNEKKIQPKKIFENFK